jgi:coenzyme PQQ precursor peptide PqqA
MFPSHFSRRNMSFLGKISLANFSPRSNLAVGRIRPNSRKWSAKMAWKAPKIVEVPCGMEINMYVSATRK